MEIESNQKRLRRREKGRKYQTFCKNDMNKKLFWGIAVAAVIVFGILFFPWKKETAKEEPPKTDNNAKWQESTKLSYHFIFESTIIQC